MKKMKYLSIFVLLFGSLAFACNEDSVNPLKGGGDDEEDPPIVITPDVLPGEDSTAVTP